MKTNFWLVAAMLLTGVNEPIARAEEKGPQLATVTGWLAYRTTCQGGLMTTVAGEAMPEALRPQLILAETAGNVPTAVVTTDEAGQFLLEKVPAGNYELRIQHQLLGSFWMDGARTSIPVSVADGEFISLGVLCEDNTPPENAVVRAVWGTSTATFDTPDATLDIELGATTVSLSVTAQDPEGDPVHSTFETTTGEIVATKRSVIWDLNGVEQGPAQLNAWVSDGMGGVARLVVPVRFHAANLAGAPEIDPQSLRFAPETALVLASEIAQGEPFLR